MWALGPLFGVAGIWRLLQSMASKPHGPETASPSVLRPVMMCMFLEAPGDSRCPSSTLLALSRYLRSAFNTDRLKTPSPPPPPPPPSTSLHLSADGSAASRSRLPPEHRVAPPPLLFLLLLRGAATSRRSRSTCTYMTHPPDLPIPQMPLPVFPSRWTGEPNRSRQ